MNTPPRYNPTDHTGSRKKIKLRHTEPRSLASFDLTSLDSALDLECDIEMEYKKQLFGEDENSKPVHPNILHDLSEDTTCCTKAYKDNDKMSGQPASSQNLQDSYVYEEYLSRTRKYLNHLNTMEDDEELMFSVRAKLFEYVDGYDHYFDVMSSHLIPSNQIDGPARWIERGKGQVKFLRDLEEGITCGTVRIAMQHEGTLNPLMNHLIEPGLEATSSRDKKLRRYYMWCTKDLTAGVSQRTFALRFANDRDALSWKDHFERAKKATGDARLALDPECYAPPNSSDNESVPKLVDDVTLVTDIDESIPVTSGIKRSPELQKRRRVSI